MAASDYLASELLSSIRRRGMIPASDDTWSDTELLRLANEELPGYMAQLLFSLRQEHLIQRYDQAVVSGQAFYRVPPRAVESGLRQVTFVATDGSESDIDRVEPERRFSSSGYLLEGDTLELIPKPAAGATLRIRYQYIPKLIQVASGAKILTIAGDRLSLTATVTIPWSGTQLVDFVRASGAFQPVGLDTTAAAPSGASMSLTGGAKVPTDIAIGDYVCLAGESILPPLSPSLHPLLAQRCAYVALRALGDPKAESAKDQMMELRSIAMSLLQPRTPANPRVVINRFAPGWAPGRRGVR